MLTPEETHFCNSELRGFGKALLALLDKADKALGESNEAGVADALDRMRPYAEDLRAIKGNN